MRGLFAVARREIEEKRFVFAAAAVAALVPFAVPFARGLHGAAAQDAREVVTVLLTGVFLLGLGVVLGGSAVSRELADRRIGFYFSRPVPALSIWGGKLLGSCLLIAATTAVILLPAWIAGGLHFSSIDTPASALPAITVAAILFVPVLDAASIAVRSRSPLLVLDIGFLVASSLILYAVYQRLLGAFALEAFSRGARVLAPLLAASVLAAGYAAVALGRTEIRSAHRALSGTLWGMTGLGVLAFAAWAAWVLAASPRNLSQISAALPASRGSWIVVQGEARGAEPAFLFEPTTGRYLRAGASWRWPLISPDGRSAAWFEPFGPEAPFHVVTWQLSDPLSRPARTTLSFAGTPRVFLSEHGERLATIKNNLLSIYDLASGASLGSANLGQAVGQPRGFFVGPDLFRVYLDLSGYRAPAIIPGLEILEFNLSTKTLQRTGRVEEANSPAWSASPSGSLLLVRERSRLTLRDGRSGALVTALVQGRGLGRFVSGEHPVVGVVSESGVRLEVFAPDGRRERTIPIPARDRVALGGEIAAGRLVVAAGGTSAQSLNRAIFLVDLSSGEVQRVADGLFPVAHFAVWNSNQPNYQAEPGSEATKLFYGPGGSLVHFDPLTGERRTILGRRDGR